MRTSPFWDCRSLGPEGKSKQQGITLDFACAQATLSSQVMVSLTIFSSMSSWNLGEICECIIFSLKCAELKFFDGGVDFCQLLLKAKLCCSAPEIASRLSLSLEGAGQPNPTANDHHGAAVFRGPASGPCPACRRAMSCKDPSHG